MEIDLLLLLLVCILTAVVIHDRIVFKKHRNYAINYYGYIEEKFTEAGKRYKEIDEVSDDVVYLKRRASSLESELKEFRNDINILKQPVKFQIDQKVNFKIGNDVYKSGKIAYCQRHHSGNLYSILHKNNRYRGVPEKDIY